MENREPKFDAITGEPIEGLPDRTAPTTDEQVFTDMLMGEPDFYDPNHWCEQQQVLKDRVSQLETSRTAWIVGLLLVIGVMGWLMWDQKSENANLFQRLRDLYTELCSKPGHDPDVCLCYDDPDSCRDW
jgi:hypothetical protein